MEEVFLVFIPGVCWPGPRGGSKGPILKVEKPNPVGVYGDPSYQIFLWIFLCHKQIDSP